jgi:hypothetical protein
VTRQTDPRIAAQIWAALGDADTVLNVGAGTGSYEPADRKVVAVDPLSCARSGAGRSALCRCDRGKFAVRGSVIRRSDGNRNDPSLAGPDRWPA